MQLLLPHFRFPAQWESRSQSPPPTSHGLKLVQQLQSVIGIPLHREGAAVTDVVVGGTVVVVVGRADVEVAEAVHKT